MTLRAIRTTKKSWESNMQNICIIHLYLLINFQLAKNYFCPGFYFKEPCTCFIIFHKFSLKLIFYSKLFWKCKKIKFKMVYNVNFFNFLGKFNESLLQKLLEFDHYQWFSIRIPRTLLCHRNPCKIKFWNSLNIPKGIRPINYKYEGEIGT